MLHWRESRWDDLLAGRSHRLPAARHPLAQALFVHPNTGVYRRFLERTPALASSFNRVTLVGYLGQDPTSTFLPLGDQVTNFQVACNERWKDRSGLLQEHTLWFSCATFGRLAERSQQLLRKGAYVYVEGRLSTREYTDRQGQTRTSLDVRCAEMRLLDRLPDGGPDCPFGAIASPGAGAHPRPGGEDQSLLDEVPF